MDLVGRRRELTALDRLFDAVAGGAGGTTVIIGRDGIGKTALLGAAANRARQRGFAVVRLSVTRPGLMVWAQLLRELDEPELADRLLVDPDVHVLDDAARHLVSVEPRVIALDDIDRGGVAARELLDLLAARIGGTATGLVVTSTDALDLGTQVRLTGLDEDEFAALLADVAAPLRHEMWLATSGLPGPALAMAADLAVSDEDPLVAVALRATSTTPFYDIDVALIRLLEQALQRVRDDAPTARVLGRLAHELTADASSWPRRRSLLDEALMLARRSGERAVLAEVLETRLNALWDPAGATERLLGAEEIIELARSAGDRRRELAGLLMRFTALIEMGRVVDAESTLAVYEHEAALEGDESAVALAEARHVTLAVFRGRYDEAERLARLAVAAARRAGRSDADDMEAMFVHKVALERGPRAALEDWVERSRAVARQRPGHLVEAWTAKFLTRLGRLEEAHVELARVLPAVPAASGTRWLGVVTDLAEVAAATGDVAAAQHLYEMLRPYDGRLAVSAGASLIGAPVAYHLGSLAVTAGRVDEGVRHLRAAGALAEEIGALPILARSLLALADALDRRGDPEAGQHRAQALVLAEQLGMTVLLEQVAGPSDEWCLLRDGEDWLVRAGDEQARLRDQRGLHYLRLLLGAPGRDIAALDLVVPGTALAAAPAEPVLDDAARASYEQRIRELSAELDAADRAGDPDRASRVEQERQAVLDELRRATGLGGRPRRLSGEAERARVNVTRTLRATIERIETLAPRAGAHLQASIRTGTACRYEPASGGPAHWRI